MKAEASKFAKEWEDMGMHYMLVVCTCVFVLMGCGGKTDAQLIKESSDAVTKELSKKYKPGECQKWLYMESAGAIKSGASNLVCDSEFNVDKGLIFTDTKIYRHDDYIAVCGKVSGFTDLGEISANYVYTDNSDHRVSIQKSKSSLSMNDENNRKLEKLSADLFALEMRSCK
ncbi:hypothetical protein [Escherichia coli]|uniref:hypothetical protein n=1 Tax=Escherichia coli TaxID=562 RepID=UPI00208F1264|nr:hypothetical protein [Escherichia coli]